VAVYFEDPVASVLCDAGSFGFRRARQKQTSKLRDFMMFGAPSSVSWMPVELTSGSFSLTSLVFRLESGMYPFGIGQHTI